MKMEPFKKTYISLEKNCGETRLLWRSEPFGKTYKFTPKLREMRVGPEPVLPEHKSEPAMPE